MSFKIGQLRRNQINEYQTQLDYTYSDSKSFPGALKEYLEGSITLNNGIKFKKGETYYFTGSLLGGNNIIVKLVDGSNSMIIDKVKSGVNSFSFTPNKDYEYLVFALETDDQVVNIPNSSRLYKLKNILTETTFTKIYGNNVIIKRLGIQGPSGLAFSINGESFIMGKSEIFILNDIDIYQLNFFIRDRSNSFPYGDNKEFFIMDFEY